jgi:hypothetical protein
MLKEDLGELRSSDRVQYNPLSTSVPAPRFICNFFAAKCLPPVQATFTRRTSGYCLGTFIALNLALPRGFKCSVSHYPPTFSLSLQIQGVNCWPELVSHFVSLINTDYPLTLFMLQVTEAQQWKCTDWLTDWLTYYMDSIRPLLTYCQLHL